MHGLRDVALDNKNEELTTKKSNSYILIQSFKRVGIVKQRNFADSRQV